MTPPKKDDASVSNLVEADFCEGPVAVEVAVERPVDPRPTLLLLLLLKVVVGLIPLAVLDAIIGVGAAPETYQQNLQVRLISSSR